MTRRKDIEVEAGACYAQENSKDRQDPERALTARSSWLRLRRHREVARMRYSY